MSEARKSLIEGLPETVSAWWRVARGDATLATDEVPELLGRKLAALGLTASEIEKWSPALLDDLKRNCNACPDRQRCIDDMAIDPLVPGWESYCPNSGTLATL
jgi:hypothetical protein